MPSSEPITMNARSPTSRLMNAPGSPTIDTWPAQIQPPVNTLASSQSRTERSRKAAGGNIDARSSGCSVASSCSAVKLTSDLSPFSRIASPVPGPPTSSSMATVDVQVAGPNPCRRSEDDGAVAVADDPVLAVPLHRAGQDATLDLGALPHERRHVVGVADPDHVLLDDRPGVELLGHIVRRRADQLH